ncbi:MAG: flavodoxin family protein [Desulfovibrio sp.]|nr:flavodoxin family protein [Desulfovibrio sp.]
MRACIVYSSCTGNTRKVAEAMSEASGVPCYAVRNAPAPQDYDLLAVGFWVRKGLPDARAQRYIQGLENKNVFCFGTLGAWPQSEHALNCLRSAEALLEEGGNTVLDSFLCQGKVNPQVVAASQRKGTHPMSAARQERLQEAARHPDENDLQTASQRWLRCLTAVHTALHP